MKKPPSTILTVILWTSAVILGLVIAQQPEARRMSISEHDLLSLIFGESRELLGQRMYYLADVYYHAGIGYHHHDHDHHDHHHHDHHHHDHHHHDHDCHDHDCHDHHPEHRQMPVQEDPTIPFAGDEFLAMGSDFCGDGHCDHDHHHKSGSRSGGDWWSRMNRRLHPREHRHLRGSREEKEVLPWLWAATRIDPHNVQAYLDGAYFLGSRLQRPDEGLRLLDQGLKHNPDEVELYFAKGTMLFYLLENHDAAFSVLRQGEEKWRHLRQAWQAQPNRSDRPPPNPLLYYRILAYMGKIAELREDFTLATVVFNQALQFAPTPKIETNLREHIEQLNER